VDLIFEIGEKLRQRILTTHLAVVYLDILLQDTNIFEYIKQDLLPCTCLLLASKFDEVDDNIPLIREIQKVYARIRVIGYDEVVKAEMQLLTKLGWDLFKLTPMHFL
jgi:Cyclin, N-terminal domain